jgi:hypothetical protein
MSLDLFVLEENPSTLADVQDFQHADVALQSIPGAGFGLTTRVSLPLGSLIVAEHAAAIADNEVELERALMTCQKFPHVETLFCGSTSSFDLAAVVRFNAFSVEGDGMATANVNGADRVARRSRVGLWCRTSRFNHSCQPNCHWNVIGDVMIVRLSRDVAAGEELTVSYHPVVDTYERTRAKLSSFGFECSCARCSSFRANPQFAEAETQLTTIFDRLVLQHELRNPLPNPTKSLVLASFLERCDELLPSSQVPFSSIRFQPLTCLAMLENNAGHFDISIDCSRLARRLARQFLGNGSRIEVEVGMNLLISLLLVGRTSDASELLQEAKDSFCVRHGVKVRYFRKAFERYLDKVKMLESARQVPFHSSILQTLDQDQP